MTGDGRDRSVPLIVHSLLHSPLAGTRIPALVLDGRGAGEQAVRAHAVPAPGARWTLVVLSPAAQQSVDEHRANLAAEAVTVVVAAGSPPGGVDGAVLVDPQGVIQYVADSFE